MTFDFGAKLGGYCADMTRTVVVGKASEHTKDIYNTVLKAQLACLDMMKPGIVAEEVDAKAREVFGEKGLSVTCSAALVLTAQSYLSVHFQTTSNRIAT